MPTHRFDRRRFLLAAGAGVASVAYGPRIALGRDRGATQTVVMNATAQHAGQYLYLTFEVPEGVNRIDVDVTKSRGDAKTGAGLFDQRGYGYQSAGFRGIYGEERSSFFVAAHEASQSFLPGTIEAGEWTVIVPVFQVTAPTEITATVVLSFGPQRGTPGLVPVPEVVNGKAGWYRGDLHCHTPESSDAWNSRSAMTPAEWAEAARRIGLDFLAMTDHNVISQNVDLRKAAGSDVLLLAGEEMTNWFHGHATVSGIDAGEWLDWRQTPAGLALPTGEPGARIQDFLAVTREMGAFVAAAHPMGFHLSWHFFADAELDPAARTDSLEVWTGPFQPDDEAALLKWDDQLRRGWRVWANGGSDLHGVQNTNGFDIGTPTTVVYAEQLSRRAVIEALRAGRCFVTRLADGVEAYLTAAGPNGQHQIVGGTIHGAPTDVVEVEVLVRRAAGMRLVLIRDGVTLSVTPIASDEETVSVTLPVGGGGYVRAEVRSSPEVDPTNPIAGRTDMEAFTNPIFFEHGPVPADAEPFHAPPGPPGPRRASGGPMANRRASGPTLPPDEALAVLAAATEAAAREGGCAHSHQHSHDHDHG